MWSRMCCGRFCIRQQADKQLFTLRKSRHQNDKIYKYKKKKVQYLQYAVRCRKTFEYLENEYCFIAFVIDKKKVTIYKYINIFDIFFLFCYFLNVLYSFSLLTQSILDGLVCQCKLALISETVFIGCYYNSNITSRCTWSLDNNMHYFETMYIFCFIWSKGLTRVMDKVFSSMMQYAWGQSWVALTRTRVQHIPVGRLSRNGAEDGGIPPAPIELPLGWSDSHGFIIVCIYRRVCCVGVNKFCMYNVPEHFVI